MSCEIVQSNLFQDKKLRELIQELCNEHEILERRKNGSVEFFRSNAMHFFVLVYFKKKDSIVIIKKKIHRENEFLLLRYLFS